MGFLVRITIVGSIGGFLFGYDTGIIAGAQLYFKDDWPEITTKDKELIVSMTLIGAVFGAVIAGPISDKYGRRPVIIASDIFFTIGSFMMAFAPTISMLIFGRVVVGLGVGVASIVVPIYLSECSPVEKRGTIVSTFVVMITLGQLISSMIALACGRDWRLMLGIAGIPSMIQFICMLFMPES